MKYLKSFMESVSGDIASDIKEILLDLQDGGIHSEVMIVGSILSVSLLSIDLHDNDSLNKPFSIGEDVIASISHLVSYVQSEDFRLTTVTFRAKDRDDELHNDGLNFGQGDLIENLWEYIKRLGYHEFESLVLRFTCSGQKVTFIRF